MELYTTKEIYNNIADEFDLYRVKVWPCVARFLNQFNNDDIVLDIGCGNGKNMLNRMNMKGIDLSNRLVEICKNKNLDVVEASMTSIPFDNDMFDAFIAVASYHHLNNDNDRMKTLNEMYRILKKRGRGLIVVWAREQTDKNKSRPSRIFNGPRGNNMYGYDENVLWKSMNNINYNRYYHVYAKDDLMNEINSLEPRFKINNIIFEKGNWAVEVVKL